MPTAADPPGAAANRSVGTRALGSIVVEEEVVAGAEVEAAAWRVVVAPGADVAVVGGSGLEPP